MNTETMTTTPRPDDVRLATTSVKALFNEVAATLLYVSGEDLEQNDPSPQLYAAVVGWFATLTRDLKSCDRLPEYFEGVYPAFRSGTIEINFKIAEEYRGVLHELRRN